ncbi:hypothetical protein AAU57_12200 [Nonlabens sp. YIK11]|uniref:phage integrase SAM-like domain-containing protein n=1 Tax=Nonlabens sp. YIK11 TaxID=1453349 RepID=UPI0006DD2BEA|nr:phage integrase SAM-like domain-containing protein [Nonlabens sp. YIK11]KQC34008.1 hypothetical protein AAU57_12200 [Nonlabens sp. YIK11]
MIEAEIILDTRRKSDKGFPLKIRVYDSKQKKHAYISLRQYQATKKIKITEYIANRERQLQKEVVYCNENGFGLALSKELIKSGIPKKVTKSLSDYVDLFIQEKIDRGMSVDHFKAFQKEFGYMFPDVPIKEVDYNLVAQFITRKKKSGTGDGGISHYVRTGSTIFNEAVRRGIVDNNPFSGHRIKRKRTTPLILPTLEQVRKLALYDGYGNKAQKANQKRVADTFLFQIHIGGHYISDLGQLSDDNIKDGRIVFKRYKNRSKEQGGELVDNMLSDFSKAYLDKYGLWFKHPEDSGFKNFRDNYNTTLRLISKRLEIENLRSGLPRYIFKTASEECRARSVVVKKIQGHKFQAVDEGYIGRLSYDLIDQEHQMILDYIFG